jgi:hypothetical protein
MRRRPGPRVRVVAAQRFPDPAGQRRAARLCPAPVLDESVAKALTEKQANDATKVAELVQSGTRAVKRIYFDGDQHPSFRTTRVASAESDERPSPAPVRLAAAAELGAVSRPDAIVAGAVEIPAEEARGLNRRALLERAERQRASAETRATESGPSLRADAAPLSASLAAIAMAGSPAVQSGSGTPSGADRDWLSGLGGFVAFANPDSAGTSQKSASANPLPPKAPQR